MRFLFITLSLLVIVNHSSAQCVYKLDEVDQFTKTKRLETKEERLFGNMSQFVSVYYGKADSLNYIGFHIGTYECFYIGFNNEILINFSGGSQMTLKRDKSSDVSTIYGTTWVLWTKYWLNESELFQLQNKIITGIRIYHSQGIIEKTEIKSKFALKVKDLANCI